MARSTTVTFNKAVTTSVAAAQTTAGAADLTLIGGKFSQGGNFGVTISLTVAVADLSGANITITGTDVNGVALTETRVGPNANTVFTTALFNTVTSVHTDAALGTAMSVGNGTTGKSIWVIVTDHTDVFNVGIAATATATIAYSVVQTPDDPETVTTPNTFAVTAILTAATASQIAATTIPVKAFQVQVTSSSGNGAVTTNLIQQGIAGS